MSTYRNLELSNVDVLALSVRDPQSRQLICEAIAAYRGGAFRPALVSTWIAVAYDIISKARELAGQGDAAARAFVRELDNAITESDTRKLQIIEHELLTKADSDLQLLAPHEFDALVRLREDRHRCAHPAFVAQDELYRPSPELVRTHIVHALQHVLVHAPLQGRSAIDRFATDILSPSFPVAADEIGVFVRDRYLDRAKEVLVRNLLKAIFSAPFGAERTKYASKNRIMAKVLREIARAKREIYDSVMPGYVAKKMEGVDDTVLLYVCPFIENDPRIWDWIMESDRMRIKRLVETADLEMLKRSAAFDALTIDPLSEVILERFEGFDRSAQISIIAEHPRREFVDLGLEIYAQAGSFDAAGRLGQSVVLPLVQWFGPAEVRAMLKTVAGNPQIWYASDTPNILEDVFDRTTPLLSDTRSCWKKFVDTQTKRMEGDASDYYAYPGLRERLGESEPSRSAPRGQRFE